LVAAVDAKKIDTSDMTIAEVYESVSRVIESELKK
jgi:cytidylate kinase